MAEVALQLVNSSIFILEEHYDIVTLTYSCLLGTPTSVPPTIVPPTSVPPTIVPPTCSDGEFQIAVTNVSINSDGLSGVVTGRVEVCYNSAYGSVCDLGWDEVDARVLCSTYLSSTFGFPRESIGECSHMCK